nr:hypothetical protein I308_05711 [Cryptococcus tetragattii IND107]
MRTPSLTTCRLSSTALPSTPSLVPSSPGSDPSLLLRPTSSETLPVTFTSMTSPPVPLLVNNPSVVPELPVLMTSLVPWLFLADSSP